MTELTTAVIEGEQRMTTGGGYRWVSTRRLGGRMRTLVIIPTYLEAENIADVLGQVRAAVPAPTSWSSTTPAPTARRRPGPRRRRGAGPGRRAGPPGKGGRAGLPGRLQSAFADGYEVVVQMDADLSHPPDRLPALLGEVDKGADIAIGSRYVPGAAPPTGRSCASCCHASATSTPRPCWGCDATAGFRAYRADILETVEASATKATGYGFQLELSYRAHRLLPHRRGAHHLQRPGAGRVEDVVAHHRRGHVAGDLVGPRDRVLRRGTRPEPLPPRTEPAPEPESTGPATPDVPDAPGVGTTAS